MQTAGILFLADKDADKIYIFIAVVPVLFFWVLDSYYLLQERLFRALYNIVTVAIIIATYF